MKIYREEKRAALFDFLEKDSHEEGQRRRILAAPPLFVIPQEVLKQILAENGISRQECAGILKAHAREQRRIESILTHSQVIDELSQVTKAEYEKYPAVLPVAECFLEKDILLTYQEYRTCVEAAMAYADVHKNYQFSLIKAKGFHNIQITCRLEKWCMVSKNKTPSIHFVIHHPKLRYALENMILPIRDS